MGCDIHFFVETRTEPGAPWESADTWFEEDGHLSTFDGENFLKPGANKTFYSGRNYGLFSILANVRNGYGFAGVDTGDGYRPIDMPRGLPADASAKVALCSEQWGVDGHSHSYLTVAEILAYDWTQVTVRRGFVDPIEWARWRDRGKPETWSGGVGGGGVTKHTPAEFQAAWETLRVERGYPEGRVPSAHLRRIHGGNPDLAAFNEKLGATSPYCAVEWRQPYYEVAHDFLGVTLPRLWRLGAAENVRTVFWFDN